MVKQNLNRDLTMVHLANHASPRDVHTHWGGIKKKEDNFENLTNAIYVFSHS